VTAPDELETTLLEWAREFSEPTVHQSDDGTVTIEWSVRGWSNCTKVADDLIDVWVSDKNHIVALEAHEAELCVENNRMRADLALAKNQLRNAMGAIIDSGGYCEGPHDVADAIYRLTAERDRKEAALEVMRTLFGTFTTGITLGHESVVYYRSIVSDALAADPLHTHNTPEPSA